MPLHTLPVTTQELLLTSDKLGGGAGKENVPPNRVHRSSSQCEPIEAVTDGSYRRPTMPIHRIQGVADEGILDRRSLDWSGIAIPGYGTSEHSQPRAIPLTRQGATSMTERPPLPEKIHSNKPASRVTCLRTSENIYPLSLKAQLARSTRDRDVPYPLLRDASRPEIYEEDWLSNQEAAIGQLVNGLFEKSEESVERARTSSTKELRTELVHLYNQPPFLTLYTQI